MIFHILVSSDHKSEGTAGGIITPLAGLGSNKSGHDIDENARREILSGTGFLFQ